MKIMTVNNNSLNYLCLIPIISTIVGLGEAMYGTAYLIRCRSHRYFVYKNQQTETTEVNALCSRMTELTTELNNQPLVKFDTYFQNEYISVLNQHTELKLVLTYEMAKKHICYGLIRATCIGGIIISLKAFLSANEKDGRMSIYGRQ